VIDSLKPLPWCDFNQGLDPRLLTDHHAERFTELLCPTIRLSFDSMAVEGAFHRAYEVLRKHGIPKRSIRVYVLIGFQDTPEEALYRLREVQKLGVRPNPMRYQPLDVRERNDYVAPGWTNRKLKDYMRYWSNLRYFGTVPFEEYQYQYAKAE
jgi:hypothetical protein